MLDDGTPTTSSREQWALELQVLKLYRYLDAEMMEGNYNSLRLNKEGHAIFLQKGLGRLSKGAEELGTSQLLSGEACGRAWGVHEELVREIDESVYVLQMILWVLKLLSEVKLVAIGWSLETDGLQRRANRAAFRNTFFSLKPLRSSYLCPGFISLDMRRPWVVYWIVHGLAVLGADLPAQPSVASIVEFLATCQAPDGGFGGGPYQLPHLATTYAGAWALGLGAEFSGLALDIIRGNPLNIRFVTSMWPSFMASHYGQVILFHPSRHHTQPWHRWCRSRTRRRSP